MNPLPAFSALPREAEVNLLLDVRSLPRSRTNPQFNADTYPPPWLGRKSSPGIKKARRAAPTPPRYRAFPRYFLEE
ncbi:MAG TPA: DUF488 family protein [Methylocella sp.]|nr:DUF488 family protein [Methylocella sp.]